MTSVRRSVEQDWAAIEDLLGVSRSLSRLGDVHGTRSSEAHMRFDSRAKVVTAPGLAQTLAWASSYYLPALLATSSARAS